MIPKWPSDDLLELPTVFLSPYSVLLGMIDPYPPPYSTPPVVQSDQSTIRSLDYPGTSGVLLLRALRGRSEHIVNSSLSLAVYACHSKKNNVNVHDGVLEQYSQMPWSGTFETVLYGCGNRTVTLISTRIPREWKQKPSNTAVMERTGALLSILPR